MASLSDKGPWNEYPRIHVLIFNFAGPRDEKFTHGYTWVALSMAHHDVLVGL